MPQRTIVLYLHVLLHISQFISLTISCSCLLFSFSSAVFHPHHSYIHPGGGGRRARVRLLPRDRGSTGQGAREGDQ